MELSEARYVGPCLGADGEVLVPPRIDVEVVLPDEGFLIAVGVDGCYGKAPRIRTSGSVRRASGAITVVSPDDDSMLVEISVREALPDVARTSRFVYPTRSLEIVTESRADTEEPRPLLFQACFSFPKDYDPATSEDCRVLWLSETGAFVACPCCPPERFMTLRVQEAF